MALTACSSPIFFLFPWASMPVLFLFLFGGGVFSWQPEAPGSDVLRRIPEPEEWTQGLCRPLAPVHAKLEFLHKQPQLSPVLTCTPSGTGNSLLYEGPALGGIHVMVTPWTLKTNPAGF